MNVICILLDSLRADHLGCYGNKWIRTPNIDKFASESVLFENAYAEGLPTLPVRTALFTGRYTFPFRGWQRLENNDILLSDLLERDGYTTVLISDNPAMRSSNYMFGFEYVQWSPQFSFNSKSRVPGSPKAKVDIYKYWKDRGDHTDQHYREELESYLETRLLWKSDTDSFVAQTVKNAIRWLESTRDRDRVFFWLDVFDPHEPWDPPYPYNKMYADPDYVGPELILPSLGPVIASEVWHGMTTKFLTDDELRHIKNLYAGEVTMCDKWFGIFLDKAKELGFLENTLIIFLSDHGTPLGEHNIIRKSRPWPYEELSRIPLVLRLPERVGRGERIDAFVDTTDMMPTILDFLGVEYDPQKVKRYYAPVELNAPMHGSSLLSLIRGEKEKIRDYAFSGYHERSESIRDREWKYIVWGPVFSGKKEPELYNIIEDPEEKNNLYDERPEVAQHLEHELKRFVERLPPQWPPLGSMDAGWKQLLR